MLKTYMIYYGQDEGQDSKLGARKAVLYFYIQMKNRKLNPLFMYRAVYTYGKTEFEAIQAARNDGVKIPIEWSNTKLYLMKSQILYEQFKMI